MPNTFAENVIEFNSNLHYDGLMPPNFQVINPFHDNPETMVVMQSFYEKYYQDNHVRKFILGINPSRHGAGVTGVPFTDTKRLESVCGIKMHSAHTHEISSVFMYDMIQEFGGAENFFQNFYINSPFPLAILQKAKNGNALNANYYDDPQIFEMAKPFMISTLNQQFGFGIDRSEVFVLGKKNAIYIQKINQEIHLFERLTVLEHPRYIQQYKSKEKLFYIEKYLKAFNHE